MWTPARADLLIELCGEIGDEDTSLVERAEERAERFEDYSESRAEDAQNAYKTASSIAERFAGGQPILVGHHSEKRARKDKERIDGAMRKSIKMWDTSNYWKQRAQGAKRHAKYKERPDVRARRIKTLEADKRKCERSKADAEKALKLWTLLHDDQLSGLKKKDGEPTTFQERALFISGRTNTASMGVYSGLSSGTMTPEEAQRQTLEANTRAAQHSQRWIDHIENRLTYEREMLDEAGGTLEQQKGCETGGAVKCWASPRGGWSYIQKVNKVSVSLLDTWGRGGKPFRRVIEFDKLAGIMTAAEVQAKRDAGLLIEDQDGIGFYLLDSKPPAAKPETPAPAAPELAEKIDTLREVMKGGGVKVVAAPQLFPTPVDLAARMVQLAGIRPGDEVLEPSAGTGVICAAVTQAEPSARVFAVEINHSLCELLTQRIARPVDYVEGICTNVLQGDFLELDHIELGQFDRILMNPPFKDGADIKHIEHARRFLKPGGRLVAICANGSRQADKLKPWADTWEVLPDDTFNDAGTGVRTALLTFVAHGVGETIPEAEETPNTGVERAELAVPDAMPEPNFQQTPQGKQFLLFI
jgi:protein-L-isoaspartate O-methyltransferase